MEFVSVVLLSSEIMVLGENGLLTLPPFLVQKSTSHYAVMIAEDDGEIDTDLPELQKDDHIGKFGFKYLGIVEVSSITMTLSLFSPSHSL